MNKVFSLENNIILNKLRNRNDPCNFSIIDDHDSYHCIVDIKISDYYTKNNYELMEFLYKNKFSINGLIKTIDNKYISIRRYETHSYRHIKDNSVLICSYKDMLRKIRILEKSLYAEEIIELNNKISNNQLLSERFIPPTVKLSLIDIMSLLDISLSSNQTRNMLPNQTRNMLPNQTRNMLPNNPNKDLLYTSPYRQLNRELYNTSNRMCNNLSINTKQNNNSFLYLPGGHVDKRNDKTPFDTLVREVSEEINLDDEIKFVSLRYHNIFDKLNEKFYHNLIYICSVDTSSHSIQNKFVSTFEVNHLQFNESNNKTVLSIISV
jgi:hypothetical protein